MDSQMNSQIEFFHHQIQMHMRTQFQTVHGEPQIEMCNKDLTIAALRAVQILLTERECGGSIPNLYSSITAHYRQKLAYTTPVAPKIAISFHSTAETK
jgi:hypothetical protein